MPLTTEEIEAIAGSETPHEHEILKPLAAKGLLIRNKDGETSFLQKHEADVIERVIPQRIKEVHGRYDEDVKALTGIERNQDEKSYDYMKRAVNTKVDDYNKKIEALQSEATKGGDKDGLLKAQIDELKNQNETLKTGLQEKTDAVTTLKGQFEETNRRSKLMKHYNEIKPMFKKDLPSYFSVFERETIDGVMKNVKEDEQGNLIALNEDGTVMKDSNLNPIPLTEVLKSKFSDAIDNKKPAGTGGSGSGGDIDPDTIDVDDFTLPDSVKSQTELTTHLLSLGLEKKGEKFKNIYKKHSKALPLSSR